MTLEPSPFRPLATQEVSALSATFRTAAPCSHVVVDQFLADPEVIVNEFPGLEWAEWQAFGDQYQRAKRFCGDSSVFPPNIRRVFEVLASPDFLLTLEQITGISGLIPDPYLDGGGLHCSTAGGVLAPHSDFHVYERLGLFRRINLIIYLNPNWGASGGELQFFAGGDAASVDVEVAPELGRCVIFETDHRSVHGFTTPVAQGRVRRSLATYYYTAADTGRFGGDTSTIWRRHQVNSRWDALRLLAFRGLSAAALSLSRAAHIANPNRPKRG